MQYDLILNNEVIQTATYVAEEIPAPSEKGVWLERSDVVVPMDMNFSYSTIVHTMTATQSIHTYMPAYFDIQTIQGNLTRAIDRATESSIIAFAGDAVAQRNKTAKSIQLVRKEVAGTITAEEKAMLDVLDAMFAQVETMIADGNAKELIVNNVNITIPELEQFIASLPIAPVV